jgi:hypothetical protein
MERSPPGAGLMRIASRSTAGAVAVAVAVAVALAVNGGCARSARGPPHLPLDMALERARQALCTANGVESPRALVTAIAPDAACPAASEAARVRCYLARPDSAFEVTPIAGGYRIRFVIPALSDHVHEVTVARERGPGGAMRVEVESAN